MPAPPRSPRPRAPRAAALGPFESPACEGERARQQRCGGKGATWPSLKRGGARPAPGRPVGPETRAPAPLPSFRPGFTWSRRRATGRPQTTAPALRGPPCSGFGHSGTAVLQDRSPGRCARPTSVQVKLQGTLRLPGWAANCPRACALQASGPDPGRKENKEPSGPWRPPREVQVTGYP